MWKKVLAAMVMACAVTFAMAAVDVNSASEAELDGLKGIGPVTTRLILAERKKAEFKSWEDFIARVKGIGEVRAASFSAQGLRVNGQGFKAAPAAKKDDTKASGATPAASGAKK